MKRMVCAGMAFLALLVSPVAALASNSVLAGVFDGSEDAMAAMPGTCSDGLTLGYQDAGTFEVSASGEYIVQDVIDYEGADVVVLIYDGPFDPESPASNLVTQPGIDFYDFIQLVAGRQYRMVVQHYCFKNEGAWAVAFSGPGNVSSPLIRDIPEFTEGVFSNTDPVASTRCSSSAPYHQSGPLQVSTSGTYYFDDVLENAVGGVDVCVHVFTAPFDPENPDANRVDDNEGFGYLDIDGTIDLAAGTDYYIVTQPFGSAAFGDYFYVLAPPGPFRISKALAGAWFNPQTNGQGMFIDVYDNRNQMFVGWYTFDLGRPVDGTAQLGEPGHRWLTALGPISGNQASLDVYLARGGAFDSVSPPIDDPQTIVGSMEVEFSDCLTGTVNYTLTTPDVSGTIPVQPLADDHVEFCQAVVEVPGMPGPL